MEKVVEKLDDINQTLGRMLAVMPKPENRLVQVLKLVGLAITALGVVHIVNGILPWLGR